MGKGHMIAGIVIILAAIFGYLSADFGQVAEFENTTTFSHDYPFNNSWSENGSLDQTTTDSNGHLVIDDTSTNSNGVFISDKKLFNGTIEIKRFSAKAFEIDKNKHNATITLYALDSQGGVLSQEEFQLTERSKIYETDFEQSYSGYSFDINLETTNGTTPAVESATIGGDNLQKVEKEYGLKTFIVAFLVFTGLIIMKGG